MTTEREGRSMDTPQVTRWVVNEGRLLPFEVDDVPTKHTCADVDVVLVGDYTRDMTAIREQLARAEAELLRWKRTLCNLTVGGSEYANDPDACERYVREVRHSQHETILKFKRERDQAKADGAAVLTYIQAQADSCVPLNDSDDENMLALGRKEAYLSLLGWLDKQPHLGDAGLKRER